MWLPCYCIHKEVKTEICILSWFIMKITFNQFSILKTSKMVQLHLLRQLSVFKRNTSLQGITKLQFLSCSCANVNRSEKKKIMKKQRQKQDYEAMEPSKKRILLEKKQVRIECWSSNNTIQEFFASTVD